MGGEELTLHLNTKIGFLNLVGEPLKVKSASRDHTCAKRLGNRASRTFQFKFTVAAVLWHFISSLCFFSSFGFRDVRTCVISENANGLPDLKKLTKI